MKTENCKALKLLPQVKDVRFTGGQVKLSLIDSILIPANETSYTRSALFLKDTISLFLGVNLPIICGEMCGLPIELCIEGEGEPEEYVISIDSQRLQLRAPFEQGLFRGVQTLFQVMQSCGDTVPHLKIHDWPDFKIRGFYHDVTRGKVPTLSTLKLLVDNLARYKINHLELYIEHTFAFRNIPELWVDKDPLQPEDILALDAYCRDRYIDLVPSLSTFGHLYELLRLPRFEHLNELDISASQLPRDLWDRMAHYTLDVSNPESFLLVKSMIEEYLPLFTSRYFNICCDETFDLGKGRNIQVASREGTGRLYVEFVKKIMSVVIDKGKIPMLWGDIVQKHPELISELPPEAVFLNWDYTPDVSDTAVKLFQKSGVTQIVCPGVQGWSRFANDIDRACSNISRMVRYGFEAGAAGVLTTDWGDCGHINFQVNSFHGMAFSASEAWNVGSVADAQRFDDDFSFLQWGGADGKPAQWLRELGGLNTYHFGNVYAWTKDRECLWNREADIKTMDGAELMSKFRRASEIKSELQKFRLQQVSSDRRVIDFDEFVWSAHATEWVLALLLFKKKFEYGQAVDEQAMPAETLVAEGYCLVDRFRALWRERNRESELKDITETFLNALRRVEKLIYKR